MHDVVIANTDTTRALATVHLLVLLVAIIPEQLALPFFLWTHKGVPSGLFVVTLLHPA